MLDLSEVMIQSPELEHFGELLEVIKQRALAGELHFRINVKPTYLDTPEDWEEQLEMAFYELNRA